MHTNGHRVIIVTSGGVGVGAQRMGLAKKPTEIPKKQVRAYLWFRLCVTAPLALTLVVFLNTLRNLPSQRITGEELRHPLRDASVTGDLGCMCRHPASKRGRLQPKLAKQADDCDHPLAVLATT